MSNKDLTDEMRDELTDEELEALESNDDVIDDGQEDTGEDTNVEEQDTDSDDDTDDDDDGEEEADGDDDEGEEEQPGRDDGSEEEGETEDETAEKPKDQDYTPNLRTTLPEDFDDQLKTLATQKADLRKKYNEGEIDFDDYEQQRDQIDEQRRDLEQTKLKVQIAQEMREDRWINRDVSKFLKSHPEYEDGSALYTMLDTEVRKLQGQYESEGKDPLDPAILDEAHRAVRKTLSKALGKDLDDAPKPKAKAQKAPPKRDVPPTLNSLPAAEQEDIDGGKWASYDRLLDRNPLAFEEKMSSLSDEERNAYLASR